jgi:hypothetical protein
MTAASRQSGVEGTDSSPEAGARELRRTFQPFRHVSVVPCGTNVIAASRRTTDEET